jgi:site-specific recombinase XerD
LDAKNFVHRVFLPAIEKAGIKEFRWHDLRHTFASRLVMAGVDIRTVQELMGHKTLAMTTRYAHLSAAHKLDAVQKLNRPKTEAPTDTRCPRQRPTCREPPRQLPA